MSCSATGCISPSGIPDSVKSHLGLFLCWLATDIAFLWAKQVCMAHALCSWLPLTEALTFGEGARGDILASRELTVGPMQQSRVIQPERQKQLGRDCRCYPVSFQTKNVKSNMEKSIYSCYALNYLAHLMDHQGEFHTKRSLSDGSKTKRLSINTLMKCLTNCCLEAS